MCRFDHWADSAGRLAAGDDSGWQNYWPNSYGCGESCMGIRARYRCPIKWADDNDPNAPEHFSENCDDQNGNKWRGDRRLGQLG